MSEVNKRGNCHFLKSLANVSGTTLIRFEKGYAWNVCRTFYKMILFSIFIHFVSHINGEKNFSSVRPETSFPELLLFQGM